MKIHEYQAKDLMNQYNIPVPEGEVTLSAEHAVSVANKFNNKCVIKAQVHAGGRGKAGGIKLAQNKEEIQKYAQNILGMKLVSKQTGNKGKIIRKMLIEQVSNIKKELYLAIVIDRPSACAAIIASTSGGMDVEEISEKYPELIIKEKINPLIDIQQFQIRNIVNFLELCKEPKQQAFDLINNLYRLFKDKDCTLVEINPLVITQENNLIALDAKINFDESALFRQQDIVKLRDEQ